MTPKKGVYLFLALLLPGLLFIFLKKFGKNQFDLPVYFEKGVPSAQTVCGVRYPAPYTVSDSTARTLGWRNARVTLFTQQLEKMPTVVSRMKEQFGENEYDLIELDTTKASAISCVFFLRDTALVVMVDSLRQIRGYYNPSTREEADRLLMEMSILLGDY